MNSEEAFLRAVDDGDVDAFYETSSKSPKLWVTDDQGRTPLEIARFWVSVDYETELRRRLGVGGDEAVTVERLRVPESGTGWWERIRVTAPDGRSLEVGTGHVAFVTALERAFGIRASCEELADRALALADDDHACWGPQMYELVRRDDEPTLDALEAMLDGSDPRRRYFAASTLFCFALWLNGDETRFTDRIVETLVKRARQEQDPEVLRMLITGFFNHCTQPDRPEILRHADHPAAGVRAAVASSLAGANPADHPEEVGLLLTLCADATGEVRAAATHALGRITPETSQIRDLLLTRMSDHDPDVVWAAANALGDRDDPRADTAIMRAFFEDSQEADEARRGYIHIRRWSIERCEAARQTR